MNTDFPVLQKVGIPLPGLIPPSEQNIPALLAQPWCCVDCQRYTRLEGVCFDGPDTLYFVDIDYDILYRLEMQTQSLTVVYQAPGAKFSAVKVHPDGRLFVCSLNPDIGIFTLRPDGTDYRPIEAVKGCVVDDLAFDGRGGFYFTELVGECHAPTGRVCYVNPQLTMVTPVVTNLASPNGVALSGDQKVLWVTETTGGRLLRFELDDSGLAVAPYGSYPSYHFVGKPGPDSCTIDPHDNLYAALYGQGRFMIFQKDGYPVGQILLPEREAGFHLYSTHCKLRPGTWELYLCASSGPLRKDASIFKVDLSALSL